MEKFSSRHIHLDFHTSEYIQNIGKKFDKKEFIDTLKKACVDGITLTAKCHHGWCYYPSKISKMHPHLAFDLFGEQVKACKEEGLKVVGYLTGAWSVRDFVEHPEWQVISAKTRQPVFTRDGQEGIYTPGDAEDKKPDCTWPLLCLNGSYGEILLKNTEEICKAYTLDGVFFDIMCLDIPCVCEECKKGIIAEGGNPNNIDDARRYMIKKRRELFEQLNNIVNRHTDNGSVFYNSGGAEINQSEYHDCSDHYELEDLPTVGDGYDKIVTRSKFFLKKGKTVYGMTGKFHSSWGEFGGYKKPEALRYECGVMSANGVNICVGDQLHPYGTIDVDSYKEIGEAFAYAKEIEKFCKGAKPVTRLGVVLTGKEKSDEGIAKLLLDSHICYELVTETENLNVLYDCIILPDSVDLSREQQQAITEFYMRGGALVVMGEPKWGDKLSSLTGIENIGWNSFDSDYIRLDENEKFDSFMPRNFYAYRHGYLVKGKGKVTARIVNPYFSRTESRYCSHRNTPNELCATDYPAMMIANRVLFIAHEYGEIYNMYGYGFLRDLFCKNLALVYDTKLHMTGLPIGARIRLMKLEDGYALHIMYGPAVRKGEFLILDDFPTLYDVTAEIGLKDKVEEVSLQPQGATVPFIQQNGSIKIDVLPISGHQIIYIKTKKGDLEK